jgi:hypothetical protein
MRQTDTPITMARPASTTGVGRPNITDGRKPTEYMGAGAGISMPLPAVGAEGATGAVGAAPAAGGAPGIVAAPGGGAPAVGIGGLGAMGEGAGGAIAGDGGGIMLTMPGLGEPIMGGW